MERNNDTPQLQQGAPAVTSEPARPAPASEPLAAGASAQASMGAGRPEAPAPADPDALKAFDAPEAAGPDKALEPDGPAKAAAPDSRSMNELAKEPAVREALQKALDSGAIKYDSLKAVVKEGLETGQFTFKSQGQERALKGLVADAIPPAPAGEPAREAGPAAEGAPQGGPKAEVEKASTLDRAIASVETRTPVDERVKAALHESVTIGQLKNPRFQEATQSKEGFQNAKPSVSDAVRYANAVAVKTGDFTKESIEARVLEGFHQKTKGDLIKLAENNGVKLYGGESKGRGRNPETAVKPESAYGKAISAAKEKGVTLPEPANAEGYTVGEARDFHQKGLIHIDSEARGGRPKGPEPKPQASIEDKRLVLDRVEAGFINKEGVQGRGVPYEDFKSLDRPVQNELRGIVAKMNEQSFESVDAAAASLAVSAALAKEFKEKILDKELAAQPA